MRIRTRGLLGLAGVLALSACSAEEDPGAAPEQTAAATPAPAETRDAADVAAAVFGSVEAVSPVAEADGELATDAGAVPARLTVEGVEANETSTQLRFTVYGTTAEPESVSLAALNPAYPLLMDVRGVTITDPTTGSTYAPYQGLSEEGQAGGDPGFCLCSEHPRTVDAEGVALYSTYPALPAGVEEITVNVPGFAAVAGVPVTRG